MAIKDPWLPDFVARWYDELLSALRLDKDVHYEDISKWTRDHYYAKITYYKLLLEKPNSEAHRLYNYVENSDRGTKVERCLYALMVVNDLFCYVGFRIPRHPSPEWKQIRDFWVDHGNLLRSSVGYLVPREACTCSWGWPLYTPDHELDCYFDYFRRWSPDDTWKYKVEIKVLPASKVSLFPQLQDRLRIAVVPLVSSIKDMNVKSIKDSVPPSYSVTLADPAAIQDAALRALQECAANECDVVVFPELTMTPEIQNALGRQRRKIAQLRPYLIVAGSAHTPAKIKGKKCFHNQSLIFDNEGNSVLKHHKLHKYTMSNREQDRYGFLDALGYLDCCEEMTEQPSSIEIIDTILGRIAVLICEDLSVHKFVERLIEKFAIDLLLVPVLDGMQDNNRWTARYGKRYAEIGAGVVVATSLSLVTQHLKHLKATGKATTSAKPSVGLIVVPHSGALRILESTKHDQPVFIDIPLA